MKSFVLLLGVLACWSVASVHGQTGNYLMLSYDSAMVMKSYYDEEVDYFRNYATWEAEDMGYFTDLALDAVDEATTAEQGASIQTCVAAAARESQFNINFQDRYLVETSQAAVRLHSTVMQQLSFMNLKEYDLELFYYYHNYIMEGAYEDLWYFYAENLFYSWLMVYLDWYYVYDDLYYCVYDVLYGK